MAASQPSAESNTHLDLSEALHANKQPVSGLSKQPQSHKGDDSADLPSWLAQMIKYLRDVSPDDAWQDLVMEFVEFEKDSPPTGVSTFPEISVRTDPLIFCKEFIHETSPQGGH